MKESQLLRLKDKISKAKTDIAEKRGSNKQLAKDLKEQWECESTDEAQQKLDEMDTQVNSLDLKILKGLQKLDQYV